MPCSMARAVGQSEVLFGVDRVVGRVAGARGMLGPELPGAFAPLVCRPNSTQAVPDFPHLPSRSIYTRSRTITFAASPNQRTTRCAPARGQAALGGGSTAGDFSNRNARVRLPVSEAKPSTRITGGFSYPTTFIRPADGASRRAFWSFFFLSFSGVSSCSSLSSLSSSSSPSPTLGQHTT